MIAERMLGGPVCPEKIEEMDEELTKVIEDFDHAVNVEALRVAKETSKQSCSQISYSPISIIDAFLGQLTHCGTAVVYLLV